MRRLSRVTLALLAVITLVGGALRFDAAAHPSAYQSRDEEAYAQIARALVTNGTYGRYGPGGQTDPIHWPPGAPLLFALAYKLDDHLEGSEDWDVPSAYNWQAAVGTATILAAFLLVLLIAGPVPALVAAAVVAFYPPLVNASSDLLSEPLGSLMLTSALAATVAALRRPSWIVGVLAGLLLAGTVLTRADLLLVPLFALAAVGLVAWAHARGRRVLAGARAMVPMLAGLLVLLIPWSIFASSVAGHFVPLSSGGASNLWVGTYLPGNGSIFGSKHGMEAEVKRLYPNLRDKRPFQISQVNVIRTVAARHPDLDQEAALRAEVMVNLREYALGQPVDFAGMMASKVWRLWGSYTHGTYSKTEDGQRALHLVIVGLSFLGLLAGLVLTRRAELWLFAVILLYLSAMNAVLVSEARHNLAVMPLVACAGAAGAALAVGRLRERRAAPTAASPRVSAPPTGIVGPASR